ncbi:hypothetical protein EYF80_025087 [Liparis tanakae]|uniref:Uncharacterized protein n=1 Tax=Liparis tanakae TaxID=230148 RepID=A0A4Z2HGM5_9TELE|nr:hypothetical protein EYF80_025087 [Liparis tanakae]
MGWMGRNKMDGDEMKGAELLKRSTEIHFMYSCSSSVSDGKKRPPGNAAEKLTFRIPPGAASRSGWMLKMKTSSTGTESTADTPSRKLPSSGDRKCSWDMFWRRTVTLLPSMSSVMMRTRRIHWAEMLWTPSEEIRGEQRRE